MRVGNSSAKTAAMNFIVSLLWYFIYPLSATLAPYPRLIIGFCTKMIEDCRRSAPFSAAVSSSIWFSSPKIKDDIIGTRRLRKKRRDENWSR